jgi:hypothetical protein
VGRHGGGPGGVEAGVSTPHHSNDRTRIDSRSAARCLRHHVWMAYCGDCRDAHAPILRGNRTTGSTSR